MNVLLCAQVRVASLEVEKKLKTEGKYRRSQDTRLALDGTVKDQRPISMFATFLGWTELMFVASGKSEDEALRQ